MHQVIPHRLRAFTVWTIDDIVRVSIECCELVWS